MKRILLLLTICGVFVRGAQAAPVAMACHVAGKPQVSSGASWAALRVLQKLEAGTKVRCAAGDEAVLVMLGSGARFKVGTGQTATIGANAVTGGSAIGGAGAASTRVAMALGTAKTGAVMARSAPLHRPLYTRFPGWLPQGTRDLKWDTVPGAANYSFGLFDGNGTLLWGTQTAQTTATLPENNAFVARRPYIWRLTPLGESGKPLPNTYWGVLTFLEPADAAQLSADARELEAQSIANPTDATPRAFLAELYRSYGVGEKTLTNLEWLRDHNQTGAQNALAEAYAELGPFAVLLAGKEALAEK